MGKAGSSIVLMACTMMSFVLCVAALMIFYTMYIEDDGTGSSNYQPMFVQAGYIPQTLPVSDGSPPGGSGSGSEGPQQKPPGGGSGGGNPQQKPPKGGGGNPQQKLPTGGGSGSPQQKSTVGPQQQPQNNPVSPPVGGLAGIFLEGHNVIRRQRGVPDVSWDPAMEGLAQKNASRQVQLGLYGHEAWNSNHHGTGSAYPENGFVGTPAPGWTAQGLADSPGHRPHVLGSNVSKIGCAFVPGRLRGGYCAGADESPGHPCNQGQNICFYNAWGNG